MGGEKEDGGAAMKKMTIALIGLFLVGLSIPTMAGWNFKSLRNLQVNVEYSGYSSRNFMGDPIYYRGQTLRYRISIYNKGNRPFKNFPVESTLYWAGAVTCTLPDGRTVSFGGLQTLPGNSSSGLRPMTIPKNGMAFFDVTYVLPRDVCPNLAEIRIDAGKGGGEGVTQNPDEV